MSYTDRQFLQTPSAMSLLGFLTNTASLAVLNGNEQKSITTSITALEQRLDQHFSPGTIKRKFRFGSSTRGTILPRAMDEHSDIDYMIVFSDSSYTPSTYLNRLRTFVEAKYPSSSIYQSHPTIVLELHHIKFDLVPATEAFFFGLQIPCKDRGWTTTNPNDFNGTIERINANYASLIKPAIRLVKYWNATSGYPFESFELEKRVCEMSFGGASNLRDIFFSIFDNLRCGIFSAKWIVAEVTRAKIMVKKMRELEGRGATGLAELEARRLLRIR